MPNELIMNLNPAYLSLFDLHMMKLLARYFATLTKIPGSGEDPSPNCNCAAQSRHFDYVSIQRDGASL